MKATNDINIIINGITIRSRLTVIEHTIPEKHNHTTEEAHHAETENPTEKLLGTGI